MTATPARGGGWRFRFKWIDYWILPECRGRLIMEDAYRTWMNRCEQICRGLNQHRFFAIMGSELG